MLESLKKYLSDKGFSNIFLDIMPPAEKFPDVIGLMEWNAPISQTVGEITHYIQIQVRRSDYESAKSDCTQIMQLLDSGENEQLIQLDDNTLCISRPRRAPIILERGSGYTVFYCELAMWD